MIASRTERYINEGLGSACFALLYFQLAFTLKLVEPEGLVGIQLIGNNADDHIEVMQ